MCATIEASSLGEGAKAPKPTQKPRCWNGAWTALSALCETRGSSSRRRVSALRSFTRTPRLRRSGRNAGVCFLTSATYKGYSAVVPGAAAFDVSEWRDQERKGPKDYPTLRSPNCWRRRRKVQSIHCNERSEKRDVQLSFGRVKRRNSFGKAAH